MAGEGLFFTGQVLKNNRDLLKEDNARQKLALQREQLELQKQAAADKRRADREKGKKDLAQTFSIEDINADYVPFINNSISDYKGFVSDNYQAIQDGDSEVLRQKREMERDLTNNTALLKQRSTSLQNYRTTVDEGEDLINFNVDDDGNYMHENYHQQFLDGMSQGLDISELNKQYNIDSKMTVEGKWEDPSMLLIKAAVDEPKGTYINKKTGEEFGIVSGKQKDTSRQEIARGLTISDNLSWDNLDYRRIYNRKRVRVSDGTTVNAQEAFFAESYQGGGNTNPSPELLAKLDPSNENLFDRKVADEYANYLAGKITEEGFKNAPPVSKGIPSKVKGKGDESVDTSFYYGQSKNVLPFGDVQVKGDEGFYDESATGKVSIGPESLLPGQAGLSEEFNKEFQSLVGGGDQRTVPANVIGVYVTSNNVPVAKVQLEGGNQQVLVPLSNLSNFAEKLKGRAGEIYSMSKQSAVAIDTSKY